MKYEVQNACVPKIFHLNNKNLHPVILFENNSMCVR